MKIKDLFDVTYGINMELNKCEQTDDPDGINFVSRFSENNGVSARVKRVNNKEPHSAGLLTCAAGSSSVLSTFVQTKPFYTGRDVYILSPKKEMTLQEKLFYCMCIKYNAYRYYYGRQANKTLKDHELPDEIPKWVYKTEIKPITTNNHTKEQPINIEKWKEFKLGNIFDIYLAKSYHKINLDVYEEKNEDLIAYISRTGENNGLNCYVMKEPYMNIEKPNAITVGAEGVVYFYQNEEFICGNKVSILRNSKLNKYNALFLTTVLNFDLKKRYNYGRALIYGKVIEEKVFLPSTDYGDPNWQFMENYVKSLYFSDKI